jgi:hypothetical protein
LFIKAGSFILGKGSLEQFSYSVVRNSFWGAGLVVACSDADDQLEVEIRDDTEACSVTSLLNPVNVKL